jgi:hypothetical protein
VICFYQDIAVCRARQVGPASGLRINRIVLAQTTPHRTIGAIHLHNRETGVEQCTGEAGSVGTGSLNRK